MVYFLFLDYLVGVCWFLGSMLFGGGVIFCLCGGIGSCSSKILRRGLIGGGRSIVEVWRGWMGG